MIHQTIRDLEDRIRSADSLNPSQKEELQTLVQLLRNEVDHGPVVARLREALDRFEKEHPSLTLTVNGLSTYLANIGL